MGNLFAHAGYCIKIGKGVNEKKFSITAGCDYFRLQAEE